MFADIATSRAGIERVQRPAELGAAVAIERPERNTRQRWNLTNGQARSEPAVGRSLSGRADRHSLGATE
jgi:hypothetical protein